MSNLVVSGGAPLSGKVIPSGSKNSALPIIFATVLCRGVSVLYGVPDITDVRVSLEIISTLGASCTRIGEALYIDTSDMEYTRPPLSLVTRIRASSYLLGSCVGRFGRAHISAFGGCAFENRPIDMHISAAQRLGCTVWDDLVLASSLVGTDIRFDKASVGATVNTILLASRAKGRTRIFGYARETHIMNLISFLRTAGAKITLTDGYIEIEGRTLTGGVCRIIPDMIEAGTYLSLSLATGSDISVVASGTELASFLAAMVDGGAVLTDSGGEIALSGSLSEPLRVTTAPHPGFPTDLQPQTAPVMARYSGGEIIENVWRSRFGYLDELSKFGVEYTLMGNRAEIMPSRLHSAVAVACDLRAGAALLIAALMAEGESVIKNAEVIDRGYERIIEKLRELGAKIERTE